jgi:tetratricopeptide (TPR) repeat protein
MSKLFLDTLRLPVADVGPQNPLPLLNPLERLDRPSLAPAAETDAPAGMAGRLQDGRVVGGFPYSCQDGYRRELVEREVRVAVLESARLRATFLLDYGGRLWSLLDLDVGRELLFNPGKIQLANLGLRNAWFAGGVEWNLGTAAHSPFTCAPLHAAVAEGPQGQPALRLYEYERLRGVVFQLDAWLSEDAPFLKVHVRLHNPRPGAVPMWWWSNVAVSQAPDVRVVAPAETAWYYKYDGRGLRSTSLPEHDGSDVTYPGRTADAAEYFFRPGGASAPWVAAVDGSGAGLVQLSTRKLLGRKVFRWGSGPGGRRWQDWLGDQRWPYLEIQGGITETQMEHVRMPADATWSWLEAYGPVQVDPERAHGSWADARGAVGDVLAATGSLDLEGELGSASFRARQPPRASVWRGSGWGALERLRREVAGEAALSDEGAPFSDDTLGEDQEPWLELLDPSKPPSWLADHELPREHVKDGDWGQRLEQLGEGWLPVYLRGLLAHAEGNIAEARRLLEHSLATSRTSWALRALALLDLAEGDAARASDHYLVAHKLSPGSTALAIEAAQTLLRARRPEVALEILARFPDEDPRCGRSRLLRAQALADTGETARARELLDAGIEVADLREGESGLDRLWSSLNPGIPVPARYDFRLRQGRRT